MRPEMLVQRFGTVCVDRTLFVFHEAGGGIYHRDSDNKDSNHNGNVTSVSPLCQLMQRGQKIGSERNLARQPDQRAQARFWPRW